METEVKFKFQAAWVVFISLLAFSILYKFFTVAINETSFDFSFLFAAIVPVCISWVVLPMTFKMIRGVPAMTLTKNYLVDNLGGHSIEWADIAEIRAIDGNNRSFSKLIINLKQPEKYFDTPIKKLLYKFRQLFTANDIGIILDFVSGKDEEITQIIHAYWDKHAGL